MDNGFEEEKAEKKAKATKRQKNILYLCITAVIIFIGVVAINGLYDYNNRQMEEKYQTACELAFSGKYEEALEVLDTFASSYGDSFALGAFCRGHIKYDENDIVGAYKELDDIDTFSLSEGNKDIIAAFKKRVNREYLDALWGRYFENTATTVPTTTQPTTSRVPSTTKKSYSSYRLGVERYSDPEDFYYDNEDYFEDYQDAEDYYNRYH